jgi:hypothetical protein
MTVFCYDVDTVSTRSVIGNGCIFRSVAPVVQDWQKCDFNDFMFFFLKQNSYNKWELTKNIIIFF